MSSLINNILIFIIFFFCLIFISFHLNQTLLRLTITQTSFNLWRCRRPRRQQLSHRLAASSFTCSATPPQDSGRKLLQRFVILRDSNLAKASSLPHWKTETAQAVRIRYWNCLTWNLRRLEPLLSSTTLRRKSKGLFFELKPSNRVEVMFLTFVLLSNCSVTVTPLSRITER